jgi:hypothetical protein
MLQFNSNDLVTIPALLVKNISRELILSVEEALDIGAERAFSAAVGMDDGHLPHVVGTLRHFHMNETFHTALVVNNSSPSPIKGNGVVTGRTGIFTVARFNIPEGFWINGRRSKTRRQMSYANKAIEPLVQPELFNNYETPTEATVFFVSCFSRSLHIHPTRPVSIDIAVPDREMRGWLFRESVSEFLKRYDQAPVKQSDLAVPKLKNNIKKQKDKDGTAE